MKYRVIVLDFDGVIVESNDIKHEAFAKIFSRYPKYFDTVMSFHRSHNHLSRREKFKYFVEQIMGKTGCESEIDSLTKEFETLTRTQVISCAYVKGAKEFIDYFYGKIPLYISSATPEVELRIILKARNLLKSFKDVFGPPRKKPEALKEIIHREKVAADQILFIGDSPEDYLVARDASIDFIARKIKEVSFKEAVPAFTSLDEAQKFILNT